MSAAEHATFFLAGNNSWSITFLLRPQLVNTHREVFLVNRRRNRLARVFSPKVEPDPTVQKQLEDRVKAVIEEMLKQKRAFHIVRQDLPISPEPLQVLRACR